MSKKNTIYQLFWVFFISCFIGDLAEVVYCRFSMGSWMSRSSLLYGQFSVVWGLGAVLLTLSLQHIASKGNMAVFLTGFLLGGVYEYVCSLVIEGVFGVKFWDYSKFAWNLNGRINLPFCIVWGFISLAWVRLLYPKLSALAALLTKKVSRTVTQFFMLAICCNILLSASALIRMSERQSDKAPSSVFERFLDQRFPDTRLKERYPNMKFLSS